MSESRKTGVRPKLTALVAAADEGGAVQGASRAAARPAIACRLETAIRSARSRPMRLCSIRFLPTAARFLTTRSRTPDIHAREGYLPRDQRLVAICNIGAVSSRQPRPLKKRRRLWVGS